MWNCEETAAESPLPQKTTTPRKFFLPYFAELDILGTFISLVKTAEFLVCLLF